MKPKKRAAFALGLVFAAIGYLGFTSFTSATTYYYTVDEYRAREQELAGEFVQVNGAVVPGSIDWDAARVRLAFSIEKGGEVLPVVYEGVKPDVLQDGIDAVVAGRLEDGIFRAERVLVVCPSKYEGKTGRT